MSARCGRRGAALVAALSCLAVLLGACTAQDDPPPESPEPPPPVDESRPQVGIEAVAVLPPRSRTAAAILAAMEVDLQVLEGANGPELRSLRLLTPDEPVFVRDLALFAGQRSVGLTCILGSEGPSLLPDLALLRPTARFCATVPGEPEEPPPSEIDLLVVRYQELGHVVGVAAEALGGDRVAIATGTTELEGQRFVEGVVAGSGGLDVILLDDEPGEPGEPDELVARAVARGADSVLVGSGLDAPGVIEAARAAGLGIIGPQPLSAVEDDGGFDIAWGVRWDRVLQPSIDRVVGRPEPAARSTGFAQGVFDVHLPQASAFVEDLIERAIEEIEAGDRDPLQVRRVPEEPDAPPDDDPDDDLSDAPDDAPDDDVGDDAPADDDPADDVPGDSPTRDRVPAGGVPTGGPAGGGGPVDDG